MNVTLTPSDNGFDVSHPALPGPISLTAEVGRQFAKALVSPELDTPAFKSDKNIWAPQTREPLGLWLTEAGVIQLWIAGQVEDITRDEATALASDVLLASAVFKIGDEVETTSELFLFSRADITAREAADAIDRLPKLAANGSYGTVVSVELFEGKVAYRLQIGDAFTFSMYDHVYKAAPPIQTYRVERDIARYLSDAVTVSARSPAEARKLGEKARCPTGYGLIDVIDVELVTGTDDELNRAEGFFVDTSSNSLGLTDDSPFAEPADLVAFLVDKAFAGSRRHQRIVRDVIAPTSV